LLKCKFGGCGLLYTGEQRKKLTRLHNELETIIMGKAKWTRSFPPSFYYATIL
jgi:hypothetical protein